MKQDLVEALRSARDETVRVWAARIHQSSSKYRSISAEDIAANVGRFMDATIDAVGTGDYGPLEEVVGAICSDRAARGFDVTEIQRGLLMGCEAILPALEKAFRDDAQTLVWSVTQIERVMQRAAQMLHRQFELAHARQTQSVLAAAVAECDATRRRLQAALDALGHAAVVAGPDLVLTWVDERAASAEFGMHAPGDAHECASESLEDCALAAALRTGEVQRRDPSRTCKVQVAIPVRSPEGEVVEALALF